VRCITPHSENQRNRELQHDLTAAEPFELSFKGPPRPMSKNRRRAAEIGLPEKEPPGFACSSGGDRQFTVTDLPTPEASCARRSPPNLVEPTTSGAHFLPCRVTDRKLMADGRPGADVERIRPPDGR